MALRAEHEHVEVCPIHRLHGLFDLFIRGCNHRQHSLLFRDSLTRYASWFMFRAEGPT